MWIGSCNIYSNNGNDNDDYPPIFYPSVCPSTHLPICPLATNSNRCQNSLSCNCACWIIEMYQVAMITCSPLVCLTGDRKYQVNPLGKLTLGSLANLWSHSPEHFHRLNRHIIIIPLLCWWILYSKCLNSCLLLYEWCSDSRSSYLSRKLRWQLSPSLLSILFTNFSGLGREMTLAVHCPESGKPLSILDCCQKISSSSQSVVDRTGTCWTSIICKDSSGLEIEHVIRPRIVCDQSSVTKTLKHPLSTKQLSPSLTPAHLLIDGTCIHNCVVLRMKSDMRWGCQGPDNASS